MANHPNRGKRATSKVIIDGVEMRKVVYGGYRPNLGHEEFWCNHGGDHSFPLFLVDHNDWSKGYTGSTK